MPKKLTKVERIERFLIEGLGMKEVKSSSRKYRKFEGGTERHARPIWLGKKGAVRAGLTSSSSISVTHIFVNRAAVWEKREGKEND